MIPHDSLPQTDARRRVPTLVPPQRSYQQGDKDADARVVACVGAFLVIITRPQS